MLTLSGSSPTPPQGSNTGCSTGYQSSCHACCLLCACNVLLWYLARTRNIFWAWHMGNLAHSKQLYFSSLLINIQPLLNLDQPKLWPKVPYRNFNSNCYKKALKFYFNLCTQSYHNTHYWENVSWEHDSRISDLDIWDYSASFFQLLTYDSMFRMYPVCKLGSACSLCISTQKISSKCHALRSSAVKSDSA
jgi:hypothetical protein